jgi:hypothetical protein
MVSPESKCSPAKVSAEVMPAHVADKRTVGGEALGVGSPQQIA